MDYMFYTPPNTEPNLDHSIPFDQGIALLEGQHFAAAQELSTAQAQTGQPVDSDLAVDDKAGWQQTGVARVENAKAALSQLEQQIADARAAWQAQLDAANTTNQANL